MTKKNINVGYVVVVTVVLFVFSSVKDIKANNIDKLICDLKSRDFQTRMQAVEELGKVIDKKTLNIFRKYIFVKTEDWKIKIRAIEFMGMVDDREVSSFLIKIVSDPFLNEGCPAIQSHAIIALGKKFNNGSKAVDALIKALHYNNIIIKEAAIKSLGEIGDSKAIPHLLQGLEHKSFVIRLSTIEALGKIGDIQAIPYLRRVAENENDPYLREMASSLFKKFSSWIIFTSNKDFNK